MFEYFTEENAPSESLDMIKQSKAGFGFLPNLHKLLAGAPATYEAYNTAFNLFINQTTFSKLEAQVVFMTANYENRCHYCVAGHTWGMQAAKMPADIIEALREGLKLSDPKLQALHIYTKQLIECHGHIGDENLNAFLNAGYTKRQALEVLCGLAAKLISNYTNALAHTLLDEPMQAFAWQHPEDRDD